MCMQAKKNGQKNRQLQGETVSINVRDNDETA